MGTLRFLLGDQLTRDISALHGLDKDNDVVLMVEVADETTYVRHHKQKIVLILSAMRHFADALRAEGITVDYVRLDDAANTGSFGGELARAVERHSPDCIMMTEPGEWRVWEMMLDWRESLAVPLHIRPDNRFVCTRDEFSAWAKDRKVYRMEFFYREMRRKTGLLMDGDAPMGGQWNYDHDNRKRLPKGASLPERRRFAPDETTRAVMDMVALRFAEHPGDLEPFGWAVTRSDARIALDDFICVGLPRFGDYQDAMKTGAPFMHHGLISPYLNIGLLSAREVCDAAEAAYAKGKAPLNAAEGFIRQILGWREYVRGIYWAKMPDYAATNALDAGRDLPWFYWSGETQMNCMRQCVSDTLRHAYAHHIQRLMVTGNFALLAGISPKQVEDWYLAVYADAFEWVELPNVHGMVMWADGGMLASKPYAASGAYINRMSDYCDGCHYDVAAKNGARACPFNYLYWNFLITNEDKLKGNQRMAMPYRSLANMAEARRVDIMDDATRFLDTLS